MAEIVITGLSKIYDDGTTAVQDVTLTVADGEFLVLVGPSGCGKSTVLRCVAGLEQPTGGTIAVGGRVVNDLPPQGRDLSMVFQTYALYPHMTVFGNLAFGLKMRRRPQEEIRRQVMAVAEKLGLGRHLNKKPRELSGGERQRVALARAMINQPLLILADEPTGNLDRNTSETVAALLLELHRQENTILLVVTHSESLASHFARRYELRDGRLNER